MIKLNNLSRMLDNTLIKKYCEISFQDIFQTNKRLSIQEMLEHDGYIVYIRLLNEMENRKIITVSNFGRLYAFKQMCQKGINIPTIFLKGWYDYPIDEEKRNFYINQDLNIMKDVLSGGKCKKIPALLVMGGVFLEDYYNISIRDYF